MTVQQIYTHAKEMLAAAGIDTAGYEADILFTDVFGKRRFAYSGDYNLDDELCKSYLALCEKRAGHYPLQYICGEWPFMNIDITVGEGVLIPRSDTETVAQRVVELAENFHSPKILDLCAGSGAIAASVKHENLSADVTAVEKSEKAFYYCRLNCKHYVKSVLADVFEYQNEIDDESFNIIVSNPPYITTEEMKNAQPEILFEPRMALTDEGDGLSFYRHIAAAYKPKLKNGGYLVFEIGAEQAFAVREILKSNGYADITVEQDFCGRDRCVYAKKVNEK